MGVARHRSFQGGIFDFSYSVRFIILTPGHQTFQVPKTEVLTYISCM